ncbi:65-kDa microtubule-associated protein 1-like [Oryza glaberrima]|uniref:65-kDa microtubule-associated protein 1-like n=1 Tax=Oryza glaberrima TaxID=4538 RepID=UPI00224C25B9|nr:65-kDa microtubule-associated protein 1-like [Oryza glaberrima]
MERLKVMRNLCEVLGIDFWEKMEELDIDPKVEEMDDETSPRVNLAVELLENTKRSRFLKIKELGLRLIELRSVMIDQEIDFANVVCFIDAASEDLITQEKALSSRFLNKIKCEDSQLEQLSANRLKEKNLRIKTKIRELLKCTHLTGNEVEIDLEKEVLEELKMQKEMLKVEVERRSDIVIRAEIWRKSVDQLEALQKGSKNTNKMELMRCELLAKRIEGIKNILVEMVQTWEEKYDSPFSYDGDHLLTILNADAKPSSSEAEGMQKQKAEGQVPAQDLKSLLTPHPKLRRTPRVPVPLEEHVPLQLHVVAPLLLVPPAGAPPPMAQAAQAVQELPAPLPLPDVPVQAGSPPTMISQFNRSRQSLLTSTMLKALQVMKRPALSTFQVTMMIAMTVTTYLE